MPKEQIQRRQIRGGRSGMERLWGRLELVRSVALSFVPTNILIFTHSPCFDPLSNSSFINSTKTYKWFTLCSVLGILYTHMSILLIFTIPWLGYRWDIWSQEMSSNVLRVYAASKWWDSEYNTDIVAPDCVFNQQLIPRPQVISLIPELALDQTRDLRAITALHHSIYMSIYFVIFSKKVVQ